MVPTYIVDGYWQDVERHLASRLLHYSYPDPVAASQEAVAKFRQDLAEAGCGDGIYHDPATYTAESVWRSVVFRESVVSALVTSHGLSEPEAFSALDTITNYLESHLDVDLDAFFEQGAAAVAEAFARGGYVPARGGITPSPLTEARNVPFFHHDERSERYAGALTTVILPRAAVFFESLAETGRLTSRELADMFNKENPQDLAGYLTRYLEIAARKVEWHPYRKDYDEFDHVYWTAEPGEARVVLAAVLTEMRRRGERMPAPG